MGKKKYRPVTLGGWVCHWVTCHCADCGTGRGGVWRGKGVVVCVVY